MHLRETYRGDERVGYDAPSPVIALPSIGRLDRQRPNRGVWAALPHTRLRVAVDFALALCCLMMLSPLFVVIAVVIKLQDGGPILFTQNRLGKQGRLFRCHKFRSMRTGAERELAAVLAADPGLRREWEACHKLQEDPRVTAFGRFLRRSSLDELPQLFNVLRGEMSLVGPRPIVEAEIDRYGRWYRYYIAVRPGLTGIWQVSGRNDTTYRQRVAMDRLYVRSCSFRSYFLILYKTVPAILTRRGSY
jgi:lipopolysaccharide/colanic/teichoic acid biosynthesis glycosyltransferase